MKKYFILVLILSFFTINLTSQNAIDYIISEKTWDAVTNTWTFDIEAKSNVNYTSPNNNWQAFNIRFDIGLPAGSILSANVVSVNSTYMNSGGTTTNPAGGVTGQKFGISGVRNPANDLPTTYVILGTFSLTFNQAVDLSSIVTPRITTTSPGSFWTNTVPGNRAFNHPAPFPLPIDIKTFSATKDGDRNARLDWSTSLEINSAYFGIERSTDGNTWEAISKVAAAGNSNTEQFYTYTDRELPLNRSKDQIFYYRLQLVDLDGKYKYSDIRGVNFGKENTNKVISLYPNPAVQMVNLDLSGMDLESGAIHLRVTDMQGRNMIDKTILGNGIEPIEVTQLPAGTYNVAVSQGANLYQKQFIKIE